MTNWPELPSARSTLGSIWQGPPRPQTFPQPEPLNITEARATGSLPWSARSSPSPRCLMPTMSAAPARIASTASLATAASWPWRELPTAPIFPPPMCRKGFLPAARTPSTESSHLSPASLPSSVIWAAVETMPRTPSPSGTRRVCGSVARPVLRIFGSPAGPWPVHPMLSWRK